MTNHVIRNTASPSGPNSSPPAAADKYNTNNDHLLLRGLLYQGLWKVLGYTKDTSTEVSLVIQTVAVGNHLRAVPEIIPGGGPQALFCPVGGVLLTTCPRGGGGNLSWGSRRI